MVNTRRDRRSRREMVMIAVLVEADLNASQDSAT
ncbi:MAG: hypothetical protein ACI8P0_002507, partial [Planctomycetaceae bacterium]